MDKAQQDALKKAAGIEAAKLIQNGMIAGLGTGSTVRFLVDELGRRVQEEGLEFTGVTTSRRTQEQAEGYGIKIVDIDDVDHIDVTIDGADEVDKNFNGIKGGGAACCGRRSWPPTPTRSCGSWTNPRSLTPLASSRCRSR